MVFIPILFFRQRSWNGIYTTTELNYSKKLGYEVLSFHELQHYKRKGKPFEEYIKVLAYLKIKVSFSERLRLFLSSTLRHFLYLGIKASRFAKRTVGNLFS